MNTPNSASLIHRIRQNDKLPIRIVSPDFGHLSASEAAGYVSPKYTPYYYFLFMLEGNSRHEIDMQAYEAGSGELVFVLPHQVHRHPAMSPESNFVKLGFDESCLAFLPKQYPFLIGPLNHQKVRFEPSAALRVKAVFVILLGLLRRRQTAPELILAHLNSLLAEINDAYFKEESGPADGKLPEFMAFRRFIEENLTAHLPVKDIARQVGVNTNKLYQAVMHCTGISPKAYLNKRLILEAKRRIFYHEHISVKELAYGLGFNDPEYFSRFFKKASGQTVAGYAKEMSGF
ncbi:helix-turn-helix domain-containing protein [Mucilaginibacter pedocola]|uniref:AraC family transcriptional regulator n=1 Tax=Mucilaginibacter pedocola TaxID=1792845 RepID=A0A1S9PHK9_9SPHI|nr:helix-turn-helix domain-containing protein [Mucilaginibacter pedocola]OOQ60433.1 AraC family transcriptional regulator [Mucilaginibacter pedocola]